MDKLKDFNIFKEENEIEFINFCFADLLGKWYQITFDAKAVNNDILVEGFTFDGSSFKGWQEIDLSDLLLLPDLQSYFIDPFAALPTMTIICNIMDPTTNNLYLKDPRGIAKKAEEFIFKSTQVDRAYFGPEPEFFIFDDVRYSTSSHESFFYLNQEEGFYNSGKIYESGNLGHRAIPKSAYATVSPIDLLADMRSEMLSTLSLVGVKPILHHHEVASNQCELSFEYSELLNAADNVQKYKYVVKNVAHSYGKTASFMPKPLKDDNGSGMHLHQSLWQNGQSLFHGDKYDGLSENALYYIGGIIKHAKAINAFSNPSTNSYKRLVPGYEAPTTLAYSARNRSAAIRIPYSKKINAKRIEVRFPDPLANPYLTFSAMLMAGMDGIINKIHPGEATEQNLYNMSKDKLASLPSLAGSLEEALNSLSSDHEFLLRDEVFNLELIESYIKLKKEEIDEVNSSPTPVEFKLYFSS